MFSMRKVNASHNSAQVQHLYESYFLLLKKPALSEVQRYVFDSLFTKWITKDYKMDMIEQVQCTFIQKAIELLQVNLSFDISLVTFYFTFDNTKELVARPMYISLYHFIVLIIIIHVLWYDT